VWHINRERGIKILRAKGAGTHEFDEIRVKVLSFDEIDDFLAHAVFGIAKLDAVSHFSK
jgi:hypothetical protein